MDGLTQATCRTEIPESCVGASNLTELGDVTSFFIHSQTIVDSNQVPGSLPGARMRH